MTPEVEEKTFQEKFHETVVALKTKPLAYRLDLLVKSGAITEKGRKKALEKQRKKSKKR